MTDKEKLDKLVAEIKRRYNEYMAKDSELAAIRADECLDILSFIDSMQEEPESHKPKITLGEATGKLKDLLDNKAIDKCLYDKEPELVDDGDLPKEEPVSEDMWEASKQYALRQVFASTDEEMNEQAYLDLRLFSGFELAVAHKDGANWREEQLMAKAVDGTLLGGHLIRQEGITHPLHSGDKVKLIVIKED